MGAEAISNCQLAISNLRKRSFSIFAPTPYSLLPTAYSLLPIPQPWNYYMKPLFRR